MRRALVAALALAALAGCERRDVPVPATVSPEWQEALAAEREPEPPAWPAPDDVGAWRALQAQQEADAEAVVADTLARHGCSVRARTLGGVAVLEVTPRALRSGDRAVVYLHGGGYVSGSARATLPRSAAIADATGRRVLAVEYPLAPGAR
ncbi:MAG: hypothetical protein DCC71_23565, partial [Proteobacteria bacterium]